MYQEMASICQRLRRSFESAINKVLEMRWARNQQALYGSKHPAYALVELRRQVMVGMIDGHQLHGQGRIRRLRR